MKPSSAAGQIKGLLADPAPYVLFSPGPGDWALVFQVNFNVAEFADQYLVAKRIAEAPLQTAADRKGFPCRSRPGP